jgi:tetratricopeptide (TPR) repeat protein
MWRRGQSRRLLRLFALCWVAPHLLSCSSLAQQQIGNIIGEVRVARLGFPPKQLLVNLQSRGGTINSAYCDSQGRFGFYALPGGVYNLVIEDEDYAPVNQQVKLDLAVSSTSYANVTLDPRPASKPANAAPRVGGSNPDAIDISEYFRQFPKSAIKEYEKGLKANVKGDGEIALQHFQKCIHLAADFYPAHNELGRLYLAKPDFVGAQKEFEEAIRLNQSDSEAHLNLGNVLLLTRRYDDALKNVEEGLRRRPNSAVGKFFLGSIYERIGKPQEAERALRDALQLDPKMSKVHLELVNLYLSQQKKLEASNELKTFLNTFPDDPFAPKAKEVLKRLEK